jgi:hypothetical protein
MYNAANNTTSMGVALSGLSDLSTFEDCEFQKNRVHVKLSKGGNNAKITNCDFVQFGAMTASNPRAFVWIVPQTSAVNAGNGLVIENSKFGNENIDATDYRILIADEGSGTYVGDKLYTTAADSSGYVIGMQVKGIFLNGSGSFANPLVYSTPQTDHLRSCEIGSIIVAGGNPEYVLKFRTVITTPNPEAGSHVIGPFIKDDNNFTPFDNSNQMGTSCVVHDPQGYLTASNRRMNNLASGSLAGYKELITSVNGFTLTTATKAQITDTRGTKDAAEITFPGTITGSPVAGGTTAGIPVCIEFELMNGSATPLDRVTVTYGLSSASAGAASNFFRKNLKPTSVWLPYRYWTISPITSDSVVLKFTPAPSSTGTKIKIGRVRVYHGYEPVEPNSTKPVLYDDSLAAWPDRPPNAVFRGLTWQSTYTATAVGPTISDASTTAAHNGDIWLRHPNPV